MQNLTSHLLLSTCCMALMSGLFSCTSSDSEKEVFRKTSEIEQAKEKAKLMESKNLKTAMIDHYSMMHQLSLSKANSFKSFPKEMNERLSKCSSQEEVIHVFKSSGMKNAEKYVLSTTSYVTALANEIQKHPEMKLWTQEQRSAYMKEIRKDLDKELKARIRKDLTTFNLN
ncbi:hypothetical protein CLV98_12121 [Dyadobacter jejuensis]|uniref:DUF4142 domain-containing protein n=1 Tax=Dyadobacter jejuensis TaxID=1082580 RepID=A0A316A8I1_9BACT|nr:hypothetical protein [Dyadobacter jejuensis]PWJ53749.1 hypothetical protein CLV98_12121 [Dyadobacter jejuensis]